MACHGVWHLYIRVCMCFLGLYHRQTTSNGHLTCTLFMSNKASNHIVFICWYHCFQWIISTAPGSLSSPKGLYYIVMLCWTKMQNVTSMVATSTLLSAWDHSAFHVRRSKVCKISFDLIIKCAFMCTHIIWFIQQTLCVVTSHSYTSVYFRMVATFLCQKCNASDYSNNTCIFCKIQAHSYTCICNSCQSSHLR